VMALVEWPTLFFFFFNSVLPLDTFRY